MKKGRQKALRLTPEHFLHQPFMSHWSPDTVPACFGYFYKNVSSYTHHSAQPNWARSCPSESYAQSPPKQWYPPTRLVCCTLNKALRVGDLFSFLRLFLWLFISQASLAAMKMKNVPYYQPKISRTNSKCYKQDRWMKLGMETLPQETPFILWRDCLGKGKANEISFLTNCQD